MNDDDRPLLITVPTELERGDAFVVLSVGAGIILGCWWLLQRGVPPLAVGVPTAIALVWMLTSKSATDVRWIGAIAMFIRGKLGERDVHDWVLAAFHYWHLVGWPVWQYRLHRFGLWTVGKHRHA